MPKMKGQQIIRVSAHAILQSNTLYILQNTHKTSLITFVNSCSACTTAVLVLRSPRPSGGASIQQRYTGSQWELSFLAAARPCICFGATSGQTVKSEEGER